MAAKWHALRRQAVAECRLTGGVGLLLLGFSACAGLEGMGTEVEEEAGAPESAELSRAERPRAAMMRGEWQRVAEAGGQWQ